MMLKKLSILIALSGFSSLTYAGSECKIYNSSSREVEYKCGQKYFSESRGTEKGEAIYKEITSNSVSCIKDGSSLLCNDIKGRSIASGRRYRVRFRGCFLSDPRCMSFGIKN